MRRRRPEQERSPAATGAARPAAPPNALLALQRSAGNHAVTQILGREAKQQEQETEPPTARLDGLGVVVLESWSHVAKPRAGPESAVGEESKRVEIQCAGPMHDKSTKLMQWASEGHPIESADFEVRGFRLGLKNAFINSYSTPSSGAGEVREYWTIEGDHAT